MISYYAHSHSYPIIYNLEDKYSLMVNQIICETSSIFLLLDKFLPEKSILYTINRFLFLSSFVYFRIYNYFVNIVISSKTHSFIIQVAKNNFHLTYMYIGIFGIFTINIYWLSLIGNKIFKKM